MLPRVLHVFSTFEPGGPEVRTANLINVTSDSFQHYILAMDGRYGTLSRVREDAVAEVLARPPIIPDDIAHLNPLLRAPAVVWRIIRNTVWLKQELNRVKPDLLLTYNLGALSALIAARLTRSCPVIHTETGMSADEVDRPKPARVLMRRLATQNISALVVPSRALENFARTVFRLQTEIVRIPNGVDVRKLKPEDGTRMREQLGIGPSEFVIGCVGHLRPEKGHLRLLSAFHAANLPNGRLLILGDGPIRRVVEQKAADLDIASKVLFAGSVNNVPSWYAAMNLFALASDTEQMPMALLEAMACGLPAVCTDVGDCREILGPQLAPVVFDVNDVSGFAHALRAFAADETLRHETGLRNRHRCVEEFDSERMLAAYTNLYLKTIRR